MLWYSFVEPRWGTSNKYPQHMFSSRNKKNIYHLNDIYRVYDVQSIKKICACIEWFLMTDSICHSSLRRTVLETVSLTSVELCINPRKKVDHVCILVRHWIDTNQKAVRFVLDLWFKSPYEPLRKLALIHVQTTKAQISLRVRTDWSAPLLFAEARFFFLFFSTRKLHKLKWRAKWFSGMY